MTVKPTARPEPRIEVINSILARVGEIFVEANLTTEEMALISLSTLRVMHDHGQRNRLDYPNRLSIKTPAGWTIGFQIEKPVGDLSGLQSIMEGLNGKAN